MKMKRNYVIVIRWHYAIVNRSKYDMFCYIRAPTTNLVLLHKKLYYNVCADQQNKLCQTLRKQFLVLWNIRYIYLAIVVFINSSYLFKSNTVHCYNYALTKFWNFIFLIYMCFRILFQMLIFLQISFYMKIKSQISFTLYYLKGKKIIESILWIKMMHCNLKSSCYKHNQKLMID